MKAYHILVIVNSTKRRFGDYKNHIQIRNGEQTQLKCNLCEIFYLKCLFLKGPRI